jgi:hypothetical protein
MDLHGLSQGYLYFTFFFTNDPVFETQDLQDTMCESDRIVGWAVHSMSLLVRNYVDITSCITRMEGK